jgi:hypothetical protein
MPTNVYYAATADEQLAEAQRTLNTHVTSSATGHACSAERSAHAGNAKTPW